MKLLEVKNLKTYFDTSKGQLKAVDDVSFDLDYGEALGLVLSLIHISEPTRH